MKKSLGCLTVIILVIIAAIAFPALNFSNDHKYTITITDKERVTKQVSKDTIDSKYLIYGEDESGETYVLRIQIHYSDGNSIHLMFTEL